jgi:RNAse (barnase) inhibitor barstar
MTSRKRKNKPGYLLKLSPQEMKEWKIKAERKGIKFVDFLRLAVNSLDSKWDTIKINEMPERVIWDDREEATIETAKRAVEIVEKIKEDEEKIYSFAQKWLTLTPEQRRSAHHLMVDKNYSLEKALESV